MWRLLTFYAVLKEDGQVLPVAGVGCAEMGMCGQNVGHTRPCGAPGASMLAWNQGARSCPEAVREARASLKSLLAFLCSARPCRGVRHLIFAQDSSWGRPGAALAAALQWVRRQSMTEEIDYQPQLHQLHHHLLPVLTLNKLDCMHVPHYPCRVTLQRRCQTLRALGPAGCQRKSWTASSSGERQLLEEEIFCNTLHCSSCSTPVALLQLRCNRCKGTGLIRLLSRAAHHVQVAQGCQGKALPLEGGIRITGEHVIRITGPAAAPDTCRVPIDAGYPPVLAAAGLQLLRL